MILQKLDWKTLRPLILGGVLFVVVTGGLIYGIQAIGLDNIRTTIEQAGPLAPLIFIGLKILTFVFAPLTSGPIQPLAGAIFGLIPGTIYTLIGEVIGGSLAFWISRKLGRPVVRRLMGDAGLERVDTFVSQIVDGKTLAYSRLFLFSVYDFISYAVGFSKLPYRTYVIVSATVGIIPVFIGALVGTSLTEERGDMVLLYIGVGILCVIPLIFQKQIRRILKMDTPKQENATG